MVDIPYTPVFPDASWDGTVNVYHLLADPSSSEESLFGRLVVEVKKIEEVLLQRWGNYFSFTLPASQSSVAVTFPEAFPAGVTPIVVCDIPYATSHWNTNKTNTGFTFHVGTTDTYAQTIDCFAAEPQ
ncbi:MAG: hypothetical protein ACYTFQ_23020 [Planctomycetota bacterium]|jgi:hypothetical protein